MAIERDHLIQDVPVRGIYWTIYDFKVDFVHETATVTFAPYLSESWRKQEMTEEALAMPQAERLLLQVPVKLPQLKMITLDVPGNDDHFKKYFGAVIPEPGQTLLDALKAAIWRYAKEVPEPFGLANHFKDGKDV